MAKTTHAKFAEPDIGSRLEEGAQLHSGPKSDSMKRTQTMAQVNARTDSETKSRIFVLLCLSALVDTMGSSLLSPAYAMAVSNAPGAVAPEGGVHEDAFEHVPFSFSLAVNVITSAMVLGGVFSSLSMGPASDRFGRKPLIIIGLLGGALGYFLMWLGAGVMKDFWFFITAMFVNGLFSGTKSVMMAYLADVYTPEEFGQKQPLFGMCILTGGSAGGILGGIVIAATGKLFVAAWVGVIASVFFAGLVMVMMPEPSLGSKKSDTSQADDDSSLAEPSASTTKTVRRILLICIFAGAIDSLGDEGNRFARSTIMPQSFPSTKDPSTMSLIASSNIVATAFCMFLVMGTQKKVGLAIYTLFGNAVSALVQFGLVLIIYSGWGLVPYVTLWWLGQLFGFTSSMAQMLIVGIVAPKQERGFWTGMSNAAGNVIKFIGPLALALTYGEANRAVLVLCVCGAISLGAAILYLPLPSLMPAPAPKSEELLGMEEYEKMKHAQFMQLPLATRWRIDQQRTKDGKPPIMHGWGKYDEQRGLLAGLVERSQDDFQFLKAQLIQNLTNQEKLETFRSQINSSRAKTRARSGWFDRHTKDQEEMGRWLGEYFDDAGYEGWKFYPELFKAMVMTAFPPLEALDAKAGTGYDESLENAEEELINFMRVMDQHIAGSAYAKDPKRSIFLRAAVNGRAMPTL